MICSTSGTKSCWSIRRVRRRHSRKKSTSTLHRLLKVILTGERGHRTTIKLREPRRRSMSDEQMIENFFEARPEFAVVANGPMLSDKASRPLTVESLIYAANQLEGVLLLAPAYQSAWDEYKFYNSEKRGLALRRILLEKS